MLVPVMPVSATRDFHGRDRRREARSWPRHLRVERQLRQRS